jgi:hypothetical protein
MLKFFFRRLLEICLQSRERFFSFSGPQSSIYQWKVSAVWLPGFIYTGLQSLMIACLHLTHAFTGSVSHHIHQWLSCKIAFTLSPKNMLAAALVLGEISTSASG